MFRRDDESGSKLGDGDLADQRPKSKMMDGDVGFSRRKMLVVNMVSEDHDELELSSMSVCMRKDKGMLGMMVEQTYIMANPMPRTRRL